ncbi:MAG: carbohydrate ABC transporter permease [Chloroflexi bacterium]|nr:carbohydrate ABC transporter permease [Chloroflexota bacterium]
MALPLRKQTRAGLLGLRTSYYVTSTALAILFLAPIVWTIVTSLKPPPEASASPPTFLPSHLSWGNYQHLAGFEDGISVYAFNSTAVALGTVLCTIILSTLGGYGFSRFRFPGKDVLFVTILATLMIPFQSILVPLFLVLHTLQLQNTLLGLMLVYTTFQLPFGVFVMRNAFDSVPREIEEAGLIDGCSSWSILYRVMLTIVMPGVITVGLFAFFNSWNEFLAALIFMTDSSKFTLPIMLLNASSGQYGAIDWGMIQAGVTISMLPCLVLFLLLQRYYVSGLAAGAVKA